MSSDNTSDTDNKSSNSDSDSKESKNNNNNNNTITIRRSTFTKIIIAGVAALMVSAFLAGYNLRGGITDNTSQSSTLAIIQALKQIQPTAPVVAPSQSPSVATGGGAFPPAAPVKISSISLDGAPIMGKSNAPVTMVEFLDFQCPFCGRFFSDSLPQIEKTYVDTGKVKFVAKYFPLDFHPNAKPAANAATCANEQGKFWQMHDLLFKGQTQWENLSGNQTAQTFKKYAVDLKLDTNKFSSCFDSNKYQSQVTKQTQEGSQYGVSGTPTFYIGNDKSGYTQLVGAMPFATFQQSIDQLLQNSTGVTGSNNTRSV